MNTNLKASAICLIGTCGLFITAAYITHKYVPEKQEVNLPACDPVIYNNFDEQRSITNAVTKAAKDYYIKSTYDPLQEFSDNLNHRNDLVINNDTTFVGQMKKLLPPQRVNSYNRRRVLTGDNLLDALKFPELYNSDGTRKVITRNAPTYNELESKASSLQYDLDEANDKIDELESKIAELEAKIND